MFQFVLQLLGSNGYGVDRAPAGLYVYFTGDVYFGVLAGVHQFTHKDKIEIYLNLAEQLGLQFVVNTIGSLKSNSAIDYRQKLAAPLGFKEILTVDNPNHAWDKIYLLFKKLPGSASKALELGLAERSSNTTLYKNDAVFFNSAIPYPSCCGIHLCGGMKAKSLKGIVWSKGPPYANKVNLLCFQKLGVVDKKGLDDAGVNCVEIVDSPGLKTYACAWQITKEAKGFCTHSMEHTP